MEADESEGGEVTGRALDANQARLVKMANQIASNAPVPSAADAVIANHLRTFWTPAMRTELAALAERHPDLLRPEVHRALRVLAAGEQLTAR